MKSRLLLLLTLLGLPAPLLHATGIGWGNTPFTGLEMYDSGGSLLNNSYTFELGVWASGFTPTASNVSLWAANWEVISTASAPAASGWNSLNASDPNVNDPSQNIQYFSQSINFNADGTVQGGGPTVFTAGQQAYIWVFNTQAVSASSEWALVTSTTASVSQSDDAVWQVPDPSGTLNQPVLWNLDNADTVVFGSANGVTGAGNQVVDPGIDSLQTFNLSTVLVPEPGSALMVLVAGVLLRLRRKQRLA